MILNLKDKEGNLSGKGFNWSLFGLLDGENESKNAEVFKRIAEEMIGAENAANVLEKELTNLTTAGKKLGHEIVDAGGGVEKISQGFLTASQSASKMTFASKAAALGMKTLSVAINMLVGWGIGIAINLIVEGITAIANAQEKAIEKANELTDAWKTQRDTLSSNKKNIDSLSSDYTNLAKGVNNLGKNISLNADEYSKYNDIVNQIASMFPTMVQGYTEEGNAIIKHKGNVEELTKAYQEQKKAAQDAIIVGANDAIKGYQAKMDYAPSWIWEEAGLTQQKEFIDELLSVIDDTDKLEEFLRTIPQSTKGINGIVKNQTLKRAQIDLGLDLNFKSDAKELQKNKETLFSLQSTIIAEMNAETEKVKPILPAFLDNDNDFQAMSDELKTNVKSIVSGLDSSFYKDLNKDEIALKIKETFISPIINSKDDIQSVLSEAYSISGMYNEGKINPEQFLEKIKPLREIIKDTFDPDDKYQLNFEFDNSLDALSQLKDSIQSVVGADNATLVFKNFDFKQLQELDRQLKSIVESKGNVNEYVTSIIAWKSDSKLNTQLAEHKNLLDNGVISYAEYNQHIVDYASKLGLASDELERFLGLFTLSIPEIDIDKVIDDYQDKISIAGDALKKLKDNSLTANDVMDMMQKDPNLDWSGVDFSKANFGNLKEILEKYVSDGIHRGTMNSLEDAYGALEQRRKKAESKYNSSSKSDADKKALDAENIAINTQLTLLEKSKEYIEVISNMDLTNIGNSGIKSVTDDISKISDKYSQILNLQKEIKDQDTFSSQSLGEIISTYPNLINHVEQYIAGLITEQDLIEKITEQYAFDEEVYYQSIAAKMSYSDTFYNNIISSNVEFVNEFAKNYGVDLKNYKNLADAKLAIEQQLIKSSTSGWSQYYDTQKMELTGAANQIKNYDPLTYDAVMKDVRKFEKAIKDLNSISIKPIETGFSRVKNTIEKTTDSAKDLENQLSGMKSSVDNLVSMVVAIMKQEYSDQKDALQEQINSLDEKYNLEKDALDDIAEKQKKIYDDEKKAIENKKNALKAELDSRLEALRAKKEQFYYEKEIQSGGKTIADLESERDIVKNDQSLEGQAKLKDIEEELAKKREELADKQFDNSIKKQEDALQKEYDNFEQQQNNRLDLIDREAERYDEIHQQRLEQLEVENAAKKEALEAQIKDIEEKTKYEGVLRTEAMALIDQKGSELYDKLIKYNQLYGDGVNATVKGNWDAAYNALGQFNTGQLNTLDILNQIVSQMNALTQETMNATQAANNLADANARAVSSAANSTRMSLEMQIANAERERQSIAMIDPGSLPQLDDFIANLKRQLAELPKFHDGGIVGGTSYSKNTEVFAKLLKGEIVVTEDQVNRFYNDVLPSATAAMVNQQNRQMLEKYRSILSPDMTFTGKEVVINQGDIIVQGSMDKAVFTQIKSIINSMSDELCNMVCKSIATEAKKRGISRGAQI